LCRAACVTKFAEDKFPYDDPAAYGVHFGSTDYTVGETRKIKKIVKHPAFSGLTWQNDIAMVELDQSVQLEQDEFPTIAVPDPAKPVVQVGWGRMIADDPKSTPQDLGQATAYLLPDTDQRCLVVNSDYVEIPMPKDQYTCQAADPKLGNGVTCYGDAGGPGLQFDNAGRPVVISVTSAGGCSSKGPRPDVGVKLFHYQDWINSMISTT
jgi:secreted trypsin-like serine protease